MPESIYTIANWVLIGVTSIFGIYFLALHAQKTSALRNYNIARVVMACAYLSFGITSIAEYFISSGQIDLRLFRFIVLFITLTQAFLFTYTLITLINIRYATKKKLILETIPIILYLFSGITDLVFIPNNIYTDLIFYTFVIYYISALIRYTCIFTGNYQKTMIRANGFYTEKTCRSRWVLVFFIAALSLGILALLLAMFYTFTRGIIFTVLSVCFYSAFGIWFINYTFLFQKFELPARHQNELTTHHIPYHPQLEANIQKWTKDKQYLQPRINIKLAATQLGTNRTYLSNYINTCEKKKFKAWINNLRIEDAKKLLLQHPQMPVNEICEKVGFSDRSHFRKQFTLHTGKPPKTWRESKLKN